MFSSLIVLVIILDATNEVLGEGKYELVHAPVLDNKVCKEFALSLNFDSIIQCVAQCKETPGCVSVFYKESGQDCTGCVDVFNKNGPRLKGDSGTKYYSRGKFGDPCDGNKPCKARGGECFPGIDTCICHRHYYYSPITGECLETCSQLGTTYQIFPGALFVGYNLYSHSNRPDVTPCLDVCTNDPLCYGVDHDMDVEVCFYWNSSALDSESGWGYNPEYNTYLKNCE